MTTRKAANRATGDDPPAVFSFDVTDADGDARRGRLRTAHGVVDTPAFMPVGTAGSVKGVTPAQLAATGAQIILANTYHLHLRPSAEVVRELGGLHRFMGWEGPILTDSGGYQVFSLARIRRVSDDGVEFNSHVDGAPVRLDPATAMDIQYKLGSDIAMVLDECPPLPSEGSVLAAAVERTIRWAKACKEAHERAADRSADRSGPPRQALFGIVQGGLDAGLRRHCAEAIVEIGFDGYAIGGLSVGETHEERVSVFAPLASMLPAEKPRYLMGVGTPRDILAAVAAGVDLFDCVLPTRNGRNSHAFIATGILRMRNEQYRRDPDPFERDCDCEACIRFSRGYIRHLFLAGEMLGPTLTSIHNLRFFQRFMARLRDLIPEQKLARIVDEFPIAGVSSRTLDCE